MGGEHDHKATGARRPHGRWEQAIYAFLAEKKRRSERELVALHSRKDSVRRQLPFGKVLLENEAGNVLLAGRRQITLKHPATKYLF